MAKNKNLSQEEAQRLFHNGGTFIFLNVPTGTEFGIDYNTWKVGPNFKGVKMIPPGIHFIFYSACNKEKQAAPRTGFFHNFSSGEVLIKKWDAKLEDVKTEIISKDEQKNIEENKKDFDRFLGPYPYECYEKWISLTEHVSNELLCQLQPDSGQICAVSQFQSEASTSQSRKAAMDAMNEEGDGGSAEGGMRSKKADEKFDVDGLPNMVAIPGTEIKFTKIPKKKYPEGASAAEISQYSMDYSFLLQNILKDRYGGQVLSIIGELQFAFVCFLMGEVYDAFEQWKALVNLLCFCDKAIVQYPELFHKFIGTLFYHVREIPEDFFVDIVAQNNFLVVNLRNFFINVQESVGGAELKDKADKFRRHLEKKYGWDLCAQEWEDEDGPVVVELP